MFIGYIKMIRLPAVAGSFYPDNPQELITELNNYSVQPTLNIELLKALIVPHAGYCYSGIIAGQAYSYLTNSKQKFSRVILLGPSHQIALQGCAVPRSNIFASPLGDVEVAVGDCRRLVEKNLAQYNEHAHKFEHSLEVQLPFLQQCLNHFHLLPIVVGESEPNVISKLLEDLLESRKQKTSNTLIVISTDLSHYHRYEKAQQIDENTIDKILTLQSTIETDKACGCYALNGLLAYAKKLGLKIKLISKQNSGDVFGDKERVVGYASFIMY